MQTKSLDLSRVRRHFQKNQAYRKMTDSDSCSDSGSGAGAVAKTEKLEDKRIAKDANLMV